METIQKLAVPIAIVIAGALVAGAVYFASIGRNPNAQIPTAGGAQAQPSVNIKDVKITSADPFIGDANAPVTMAYWSDYQCPYCKAFETGGVPQIPIPAAMPSLIKNYVDTGKLKIVFKDYPFLGNDSIAAALYEHAVWDLYPAKFYAWREAMFKAQDEEGDKGFGNEDSIVKLIATIPGMDAAQVKARVAEKKDAYTQAMNDDRQQGSSFGVQGTPGFIIGTQLIAGAQPLANFTAVIDAQLKK